MTELFAKINFCELVTASFLGIFVYCAVFLAVLIDLWSGLRRSKRLGIRPNSKGFRDSINKFVGYALFIFFGSLIDMLLYAFVVYEGMGLHNLPYLSLALGIFAIAIEGYSVWENYEKNRKRDILTVVEHLALLSRSKGDAEAILKLLTCKLNHKDIDLASEEGDPLTPDYPND